MLRKLFFIALLAAPLSLNLIGTSEAQLQKNRVDLTTESQVSTTDMISGLTPSRPAQRVRSLKPRTRGIQPGLATIALKVRFGFDSDKLSSEAIPTLRNLGQALESPQLAPYRIQIEGHTDNTGSEAYNQQLAQRRAERVKHYLVEHFSIVPERLVAVGRGEIEPLHDNQSSDGREKNRRAEFVNLGRQ